MPDAVAAATSSNETDLLRAALDQARRNNAELERRATSAEAQVRAETGGRLTAQELAVDNAIAQAESELAHHKRLFAAAMAEGNAEAAADAQAEMARRAAAAAQLQTEKRWYAAQRQQLDSQPAQRPADPLGNLAPQARAWIERNPRFVNDPAFQETVKRAHFRALGEGHAEFSPEYFDVVERAAYPERYQQQAAAAAAQPAAAAQQQEQQQAAPAGEGAAPAGSVEIEADPPADGAAAAAGDAGEEPEVVIGERQSQNLPAASQSVTVDTPAMRTQSEPAPRARQNPSMASVAAPPSRAIAQAASRVASRSADGRIRLTAEEMATARSLAESIEPDLIPRGDAEIAKWYAALRESPGVKRRLSIHQAQ